MDASLYALAAEVEDEHWWFRGRRAILRSVLDRYVGRASASVRILEVGCGNGGNLPLLASYGRVFAVELEDGARERAARRGVGHVEKGWLPEGLPFGDERFEVIAALDVLEHVEDDRKALRALRGRLAPHGLLVLTVPAYGWLWSRHDELSHHRRRYSRGRLTELVTECGFGVVYSSYFNTLLFPAAVAYAKFGSLLSARACGGMRLPPAPVNRLLGAVFSSESALIPRVSLPCGVSVVLCAGAG